MKNRVEISTIEIKNTKYGVENRKAGVWNIKNGGKTPNISVYNLKVLGE
jgi:hypothetical protein